MKEIFKTIKQHFILLLGVVLFIYNAFNFESSTHRLWSFEETYPVYYYSFLTLILITIGAVLIVIGLLKIRKKKSEN